MNDVNSRIEAIKKGAIFLFPTDTIWGLGCDATNESACQKILQLKKRPENKSFILLVTDFQMLEKYVPDFPEVCYELVDTANKPLTIVYPSSKGIAESVIAKDGSVGIRITNDPMCRELIKKLRKPIVATSANLSGEKHPSCFKEISEEIKTGVDFIVKEKIELQMTTPSQIIKIGMDNSVKVLRK